MIRKNMRDMKKKRAPIAFLMVFIMTATLIPQGIFAVENDKIKTEQELLEQSRAFDEEKEKQENHQDGRPGEGAAADSKEWLEDGKKQETQDMPEEARRSPELEDAAAEIDGKIVDHDENSITYQTDEHTYVTRISSEPLCYTDEHGKQKEIDNTLEEKWTKYVNRENSYEVTLPKKGSEVSIDEKGYRISLKPTFGKLENAQAAENAVRYNDVTGGVDLQYTAFGDYVKEDIILMKPAALETFEYEINTESPDGKELSYKLENNVLNIYEKTGGNAKTDGKEQIAPVYTVSAPEMYDAAGQASLDITLALRKENGKTFLSITPDQEWLSAPERAYPVKIDPTTTITLQEYMMEWHMVENGKSGGGYKAGPNVNHRKVTYLYAGYEDGSLLGSAAVSAGARYGYTRSFLKINYDFRNLKANLGMPEDAIITANLQIYKFRGTPPSGTRVHCKLVNDDWKGGDNYTWNNMPTSYNQIASPVDVSAHGWKRFDITTAVKEWENGRANKGLVLVPESEGQTAVCFSGPGCPATNLPLYIEIKWTVPNPVDENFPLNEPQINLRPLTNQKNGRQIFTGLLADGIVRPQLTVDYSLRESGKDGRLASGKFPVSDWSKRYPDTNKMKEPIPYSLGYFGIHEANWQTAGLPSALMETVTPYRIYAKAAGAAGETPEGKSDEFIVYEFSSKDTYPYVAKYYGVGLDQITADNRPADYLGTSGSTIFIRNPQHNKTSAYTRPASLDGAHDLDLVYANLGRGLCADYDLEPVNTSTGNYMFEQTDAESTDYTTSFQLMRTYNSMGEKSCGLFGYGWNFAYEQSITKDGSDYLYHAGDGRQLRFTKKGDGTYGCELSPYLHFTETKDSKNPKNNRYVVEDQQGSTRYQFNCYGLLESVCDEKGNVTQVKYDERNVLSEIITPSGKAYAFQANEEGLVSEVTIPSGHALKYGYEDNCLVSYTNADGNQVTYEYDEDALMTSWHDGNGSRQVLNTYDEFGRVTGQVDAAGGVSRLSYDKDRTEISDAEGNERTYAFDERLRTKSRETSGGKDQRSYDENNNLTESRDGENNRSEYGYDERGNLTSETRYDGKTWHGVYDGNNNLISETDFNGNETKRTYDKNGNLLTETYADGSSVSYTYDIYGRETSFTNEEGISTRTSYDGTASKTVTDGNGNAMVTHYDSMGREVSTVNAEGIEEKTMYSPAGKKTGTWTSGGFSESYGYDGAGNCVRITDGEGNASTLKYDAQGNLTAITDGNGDTTKYAYDKNGNEIRQTNAEGSKTEKQYDGQGNVIKETDGNGGITRYEYDSLDRLVREINPLGGETSYRYEGDSDKVTEKNGADGTTLYAYDGEGNLLSEKTQAGAAWEYTYDSRGRLIGTKAPSGLLTAFAYDKTGNLLASLDGNGRKIFYTYDNEGNVLTETDAAGNVQHYAYDQAGRMIQYTDVAGNTTSYTLDAKGNVLTQTNPDGSRISFEYDKNANLIKEADENGSVTSYAYDAIGQAVSVTDAMGNTAALEYDGAERLVKETDRRGYSVHYAYDNAGNLTRYTDEVQGVYRESFDGMGNAVMTVSPDGGKIESTYDRYGRLARETDAAGYVKTYQYDAAGRLAKTSDNAGNENTYQYDKEGNLIKERDAAGRTAFYEYDLYGNLVKEVGFDRDETKYEYDAKDQLISLTENDGSRTVYQYDETGNLLSETLPQDRTYQYAYDWRGNTTRETDPLGQHASYRYDAAGNLLEETNPDGSKYSYAYDALGQTIEETDEEGGVTSYLYDAEGNLASETDPEGNTIEYLYDGAGNEIMRKDARGAVTESVYDEAGHLAEVVHPKGGREKYRYDIQGNLSRETNASGAVTSYRYTLDGKLAEERLHNGFATAYSYDAAGRIARIRTSEGAAVSYAYDSRGNVSKEKESTGNTNVYTYDMGHRLLSEKNSRGAVTRYSYDEAGNNTEIIYPAGGRITYQYDALGRVVSEKESSLAEIRYSYDAAGNLAEEKQKEKETRYSYDKTGNLLAEANAGGSQTSYEYDKNGNIVSVTDPLHRKNAYVYDQNGNLVSHADAKGGIVSYTYDEENNVTSETNQMNETRRYVYDAAGRLVKASDGENHTASYRYDKMDNLTSVIGADGSQAKYEYDKQGNLTKEVTQTGKTTRFTYDEAGRMTAKINPDGSKINYDYDALGSLVQKKYSDGSRSVVYGYDAAGNRISMSDESGKSSTTYDALGRVKTYTDAGGKTLSYTYDEYGRINSISYPQGRVVAYCYDNEDNITEVSDNQGITASYTRDAAGNILTCSRSDGTESSYAYDENDNLVRLDNMKGGHVISSYEYAYDGADRIEREVARKDGKTTVTSFTYDKAGNLSGYTQNADGKLKRATYAYNAAGNRVLVTKDGGETITVTYNADNQVISEKNSKTKDKIKYIYDENGNLVQKKANGKKVIYQYDIENRLRSVSQGGQVLMAATYDGDGNKVFQMSRKYAGKDRSGDDGEESGEDPAEDAETTGAYFDPDIFLYGGIQGSMKLSGSQNPALLPAIGAKICEIWEGIRTFITGDNGEKIDAEDLEDTIIPGTERGTLVTYDITHYLNDTNFNENAQVMYQYDSKGREKASYTYAENDTRLAGNLTSRAVKHTADQPGDYTYLYDGQGNTTQELLHGKETNSYDYDPFGKIENEIEDNAIIFGYNGEEYTEIAGLQYLRQRHYDPASGSFTSRDSYGGNLQKPQSQNRYTYAENDPVNNNDPGGDKKKAKKASVKKAAKAVKKAVKKAAKPAPKKTAKKTPAKPSASKKKAASKKAAPTKKPTPAKKPTNTSILGKAKSLYNKGKKAVTKKIETAKEKANKLKKSISCKLRKTADSIKEKCRNATANAIKAFNSIKTKAKNAALKVFNAGAKLLHRSGIVKKLADKVNRSGSDGVWGRTVVRHMTEDKNYEAALFYKYGWVNKLIKNAFAFEYKGKDEDYYYTNESRGVQSGAGFMDLFDDAGGFLGMDLDTKIVKYEYNGKNYRLQFWKGSYGFGNAYGGEIGLYYNTDGGEWYKTVQGKDQIRTEQYIKDRNGKVLIHNDTADYAKNWDHYWNLAIRTSRGYSKEMLVQESYITFHNKAERDAVIEGLEKTKGILYEPYDSNQIKVVF